MKKEKITPRWLNNLKPGPLEKYADTETRGLQVWGRPTAICFYFVLKHKGKQYHQLIGRFPEMRLEEAKAEVLKRLGAAANHGSVDAPASRLQPTIGEAIDSYVQSFPEGKTRTNYVSYLAVFAAWRSRKIIEVKHAEVLRLHEEMKDRPVMANHAVKALATAISRLYKSLKLTEYPGTGCAVISGDAA